MIDHEGFTCRICGATDQSNVIVAEELMFRTHEKFRYIECAGCWTIQIADVPADLARHYPPNYYSQKSKTEPNAATGFKMRFIRASTKSRLARRPSAVDRLVRSALPAPFDFAEHGQYLRIARVTGPDAAILDVGCGSSPHRLAAFRRMGFSRLEGIDPFVPGDLEYFRIPVFKRTLERHQGQFDCIMFHHSLEHVPDPVNTIREAVRLLSSNGTILLRLPVVGTYFWRRFGVNWVEFDAPRHLHLLSPEGVRLLAGRAGLRVIDAVYDSMAWEILESERYERRDFAREGGRGTQGEASLTSTASMVTELNHLGWGGRLCAVLSH